MEWEFRGADALVRAGSPGPALLSQQKLADVGVGRGRGRPPHWL